MKAYTNGLLFNNTSSWLAVGYPKGYPLESLPKTMEVLEKLLVFGGIEKSRLNLCCKPLENVFQKFAPVVGEVENKHFQAVEEKAVGRNIHC